MKNLFILLLFASLTVNAQTDLKFDKRPLDCEDKWVVLPMNRDSTFTYGFIYIDKMAGLSMNIGGKFKINSDGSLSAFKNSNSSFIQRIPPTKVLVSFLSKSKLSELQLKETPDWLEIYKRGGDDVHRFFRLGFVYNQWEESKKALTYLEKVKQINPNYNGLAFEFAFAYNVLKDFDQAILVLKDALKVNPKDCLLYKELIYAQLNRNLTDAEQTYKDADRLCLSNEYKGEMAHNIAYHYYMLKNKGKFNYWAEEVTKNTKPTDLYARKLKLMQAEMDKL